MTEALSGPACRAPVVIAGPTASYKSTLALQLALHEDGEIISADSIALYRGFDIGSAKPSAQCQRRIPHYLLDELHWDQKPSAGWFQKQAQAALNTIHWHHRLPIIVGGSGLYIRSLLQENFHDLPSDPALRARLSAKSSPALLQLLTQCDPQRATEIHPHDHFRLARACEIALLTGKTMTALTSGAETTASHGLLGAHLRVGIVPPLEVLVPHITARTQFMIREGLISEVQHLLQHHRVSPQAAPMQSVGYKQVVEHLSRRPSQDHSHSLWECELMESIVGATVKLAQKQIRWFKKQRFDLYFDAIIPSEIMMGHILQKHEELVSLSF